MYSKRRMENYLSKYDGRRKFQINLGIYLLNYAIDKEWDGESERPDWMRPSELILCNCKAC